MSSPVENALAYIEAKKAAERATLAAAAPPTAAPAINGANGHSEPLGAGDTAYGMKALYGECEKVAAAPRGTRNATLNIAAFKIGQLIPGELSEATAIANLAAASGLDAAEIDLVLRGNENGALAAGQGRSRAPRRLTPIATTASVDDYAEPAAGDFWSARPELAHIEEFSRARRAHSWAVLGVVLARAVTIVPPFVVLPPLIGTVASLNLFIALVGTSGGGKGAAEGVAGEAIDVGRVTAAGVGSGEGLAHLFVKRTKDGVEQYREAVLMKATEIDTLSALGDRKGATLLPELRKAWSGETLGFAYADPTKALPVMAHRYRLCMILGVQPGRARWVLDDADGGTPQRFLWLPVVDSTLPDLAPAAPAPLTWKMPTWPTADVFTGKVILPVAEVARQAIDADHLARARGSGEALDGHALLARLKVAAALGILAGRAEVSVEDWELSGVIAEVSNATRAGVVEHLRTEARVRNVGKADAEAERAITVTDRQEAEAMKRTSAYVLRQLAAHPEGMTRADLRRGLSSSRRGVLDVVLDRLAEVGQVQASEAGGNGTQGHRWELTP